MSDDLCEVTITAPDSEWLAELVHELIDRNLCASAHVVAPIRSIYRWEGDVRDTTEARAFLRSRRDQVDDIVNFVTNRHPYEIPNVTAVPIVDGNPRYLDWVRLATR